MKTFFILITLISGQFFKVQAQNQPKIDNTNYYSFYNSGGSLNWLRSSDVVPIIIDELLKKGIAYHTISVGDLIKINDRTRFVVTVSFEKADKEYGFLYKTSHGIPLNPEDRNFLTDKKQVFHVQAEKNIKGGANFMRIDPLPSNIFLIKETCYWFHFDDSGTKFPVSKEVAQNILRQDIDNYLQKL